MSAKHNRRETRYRELDANGGIAPLFGPWDRTVCFSDIKKWMLCAGSYLMWKEGDAIYRRELSQEIGDLVHQETAKPASERLQDTAQIAERLKSAKPEDRPALAKEVKKLIAKAVRVSDRESVDAAISEHESLMVWYNASTQTFWYAQPDKVDVTRNERGRFLFLLDNKTGKWRSDLDFACMVFFAAVAKGCKPFDFVGPIHSVIRYLRDFQGNLLKTPEERDTWVGRQFSDKQKDELFGIEVTIGKMEQDWENGSFYLNEGPHCNGCQFRHSCPKNRDRFQEQLAEEARLKQEAAASDQGADQRSAPSLPVLPAVAPPSVTVRTAANDTVRAVA